MGGFTVEENQKIYGAKIKVVGVGGGGGNMINHIIRENINTQEGMKTVDLIVANTDAQALDDSSASTKIQLGEKKTKGLGAGMVPEVGREAALESFDEIKTTLEDSDIVFIASGFGGGTGTGAAPVVARAAKELEALTIAVVTTPFNFEGKKRMRLAQEGIEELRKECDSIVVISNEKLMGVIDKKAGVKDSFKEVDSILAKAVSGISSMVLSCGKSDINLDFADVKTAMSHRGLSLMGVGEADGEGAAQEALQNAMQSPLLDNVDIKGAMGVLVHFRIHPNSSMFDIREAMQLIYENMDDEADIFFGTLTDDKMQEGKVKATLVATGFYDKSKTKLPQENPTQVAEKKEQSIFGAYRRVSGYDLSVNSDDLDVPTVSRFKLD